MSIRTYSDLIKLKTFRERFEYLKLNGAVGKATFGDERYLNQGFYASDEWKTIRRQIILRDHGCNLGLKGQEIFGPIYIHHMNPITSSDILCYSSHLTNPEYLICTTLDTHNAIHYGNQELPLANELPVREPNDTCPWR